MGRGNDPFRSRLLRRRAPTLRDWCAYWLDSDSAKRPKSKKEDASTLELHVYADLGGTRIDAITRHDVQMLVARWAADVMPRTVHRRYAVLRAAMNAAVDAELLDRSPCRRIRMPASAPAAAYALTATEVAQLARETGRATPR